MKNILIVLYFILLPLSIAQAQEIVFTPQWTPQSQFAGYYAAIDNGYYEEEGLDVKIVHPTKSKGAMNMLEQGKCNIITSELIQAMMPLESGLQLVNILQTTQHSTLVLLARNEGIESMSDLKYNRVGTWKIGFNEIPHMIDSEQNLEIQWIKFINSINLFISGAIDATLAKSYNEQILFSMSGVTPGSIIKFSEMGFDYPEDGLYVTEEFYEKYPEQCKAFARASRKGWEWVRNNKEEALEIVMKYVKAENIATNRYHQKWMLENILEAQIDKEEGEPTYELKREGFEKLNNDLLKYGYIPELVDYNRFLGRK